MIAPEKSELLRPRVVMRPSRVAPTKPVTTGTTLSARSGSRTSRPRCLVCSKCGLASRKLSQVSTNSEDETGTAGTPERSEEHTSELQSPCNLVCRLLLEKKKRTCGKSTYHSSCA